MAATHQAFVPLPVGSELSRAILVCLKLLLDVLLVLMLQALTMSFLFENLLLLSLLLGQQPAYNNSLKLTSLQEACNGS